MVESECFFTAVSPHREADRPGPVIDLGAVDVPVPNPCSYRISFRVPDVPPSSYRIVLLEFARGGFAGFAPVTITVR